MKRGPPSGGVARFWPRGQLNFGPTPRSRGSCLPRSGCVERNSSKLYSEEASPSSVKRAAGWRLWEGRNSARIGLAGAVTASRRGRPSSRQLGAPKWRQTRNARGHGIGRPCQGSRPGGALITGRNLNAPSGLSDPHLRSAGRPGLRTHAGAEQRRVPISLFSLSYKEGAALRTRLTKLNPALPSSN